MAAIPENVKKAVTDLFGNADLVMKGQEYTIQGLFKIIENKMNEPEYDFLCNEIWEIAYIQATRLGLGTKITKDILNDAIKTLRVKNVDKLDEISPNANERLVCLPEPTLEMADDLADIIKKSGSKREDAVLALRVFFNKIIDGDYIPEKKKTNGKA